jgi:hypothetical protein
LFLEAKTKGELIIKQFQNNLSLGGGRYQYGDPMFVDGMWVVWYLGDIEQDIVPNGLILDREKKMKENQIDA